MKMNNQGFILIKQLNLFEEKEKNMGRPFLTRQSRIISKGSNIYLNGLGEPLPWEEIILT